MNNDKIKEYLPVFLAAIGLVADIVGIYSFLNINENSNIGNKMPGFFIISILIILYSWIAVTWYFVSKKIKSGIKSNQSIVDIVTQIVSLIAIALFPIYITIILSVNNSPKFALFFVFIEFGLLLIIAFSYLTKSLLTVKFYADDLMKIILMGATSFVLLSGQMIAQSDSGNKNKNGTYICKFPYNTSSLVIKKGSTVVAKQLLGDTFVITDTLGRHGNLSLEELENYFNLIK